MEVFENKYIKCIEDNDFIYSRNVNHACGNSFLLESDNVFVTVFTNHIDEEVRQYYALCPNCGYIILLDDKMLSDDIKAIADYVYSVDNFLYKKNNLRSELFYLEKNSPSVKVRKI